MFEDHNDTIYDIVGHAELVSDAQLEEINEAHLRTGKSLAESLIDSGLAERSELLKAIADYLNCGFLPKVPSTIEEDILRQVPANLARNYGVVPYKSEGSSLIVIPLDPLNSQIIDDLTFSLNRDIEIIVGNPPDVQELITNSYGEEDSSIDDLLSEIRTDDEKNEKELSASDMTAMANETPIIRFVNLVLTQAIKDKASDIHFEPFEDTFRIRYRIDGALYEMAPPPRNLAVPVISRVKVIANLNIAERRVPQDGRIKMTIAGRPVDLRVSTLPTQFGESVVLRVLDKGVVNLDLEKLNMPDDVIQPLREIAKRPNGIFVVTGPTGSGKTTTLYSMLREVNKVETKILTAEDPVEYEIEGIMQTAINHTVGLTFAAALRSFLRQDPDKIMVGEIRDVETAQIAVQASLTGHLVLSTLHTNDASGAITRLVDMGLEPYLIAASLEAVLGQRLLRKICSGCRTSYEPAEDLIMQLDLDPLEIADKKFYYGSGCAECNRSGYRGRIGLYELIMVTDSMRELITAKAPTLVIKNKAVQQGMRTLRDDGIRSIFDGKSTIEEVLKYS